MMIFMNPNGVDGMFGNKGDCRKPNNGGLNSVNLNVSLTFDQWLKI